MAFIATPGEEQVDDRQTASMDRDATQEAVTQVAKIDVVAVEADLCFVDAKIETNRNFAQALLISAVDEQEVGSSEAIIRIAGEDGLTIDVRAADSGVQVERHNAAG